MSSRFLPVRPAPWQRVERVALGGFLAPDVCQILADSFLDLVEAEVALALVGRDDQIGAALGDDSPASALRA